MFAPFTAVLLAGAIRLEPWHAPLETPPVGLPFGPAGTLLDAWLDPLAATPGCRRIRVVVCSQEERQYIRRLVRLPDGGPRPEVSVIVDPSPWRGSAGLVRDATRDVEEEVILIAEAHTVPPTTLAPLLEEIDAGAHMAVGVTEGHEPSGLYAIAASACSLVREIGYVDLKEQLIPALHAEGRPVRAVAAGDGALRIRDRATYLRALRRSVGADPATGIFARCSPRAILHDTVRLSGVSIVEPGATVGADAVIHDSVVLRGAVIEAGAVVCRSIIAPQAVVAGGETVIDRLVARRAAATRQVRAARVRETRQPGALRWR